MPVTIKELIIRAVVSNKSEEHSPIEEEKKEREKEELINECVSQVLNIIERKRER